MNWVQMKSFDPYLKNLLNVSSLYSLTHMLSTHLMLLEVVADATAETEEEIVDMDKEVNGVELEFGMITADELELELLEVLEETSVDVVLELDTTD